MNTNIYISSLSTIEELATVQQLEEQIWNTNPIPIHHTITSVKNGGMMLGAFHHNSLIGFSYSFPGFQNKQAYLCSHMMGINALYRGKGIGEKLKNRQKEEAIKRGYDLIVWTFDPLESSNAHLNLTKLRGVGAFYIENCYGTMNDRLNQGLPSDRLLVEWHINSEYVANQQSWVHTITLEEDDKLVNVETNTNRFPRLKESMSRLNNLKIDKPLFWVPVPSNFQEMKQEDIEIAFDWREKIRIIFRYLINNQFIAVRVVKGVGEQVNYYLFVKREIIFPTK